MWENKETDDMCGRYFIDGDTGHEIASLIGFQEDGVIHREEERSALRRRPGSCAGLSL